MSQPQNFILAYGGTGARCVEAFVYLLASRVVDEPCHILMIDPDQSNGNVDEAKRQLERYHRVQSELQQDADENDRPFFHASVNNRKEQFFWANAGGGLKWGQIIGYSSAVGTQKADLIELLFDEGDLDLSFEEGYVGRAHIGSLDLRQTMRSKAEDIPGDVTSDALLAFMGALRSATQKGQHARLIVFGSVFGGTGASGLPATPPFVLEMLQSDLRNHLSLAAVTMTPYFTFPKGSEENPDSAAHPLATQTALLHYGSIDAGYDRFYLVGAPDRAQTNDENRRGGGNQNNSAHHAELIAALAAADFFTCELPASGRPAKTELSASSASDTIWEQLPGVNVLKLKRNMVAFTTAAAYFARYMVHLLSSEGHKGYEFAKLIKRRTQHDLQGQDPAFSNLGEFMSRYLEWASDLQRHTGTALFTLDPTIVAPGGLTDDRALGRVVFGYGEDTRDAFNSITNLLLDPKDINQGGATGYFIHAMTRAAWAFGRTTYSSWWTEANA